MTSILKILFDLLYSLFEFVFDTLVELCRLTPKKKTEYDADFISGEGILSKNHNGFCLTGTKALSVADSQMNCTIYAGSGMGKSSVVIIPSIYHLAEAGQSMVIHDPHKQNLPECGAFLHSKDYEIMILNCVDSEISDGYNPLSEERLKTFSDARKIASVLIRDNSGTGGNEEFWTNSAINFCALVFMIQMKLDPIYRTLASSKYLIDQFQINPDGWDALVVSTEDQTIIDEYKSILCTEKKVMANVISTVRSSTQLFSDPIIQQITSFNTIDFSEFRKRKIALFIQNKTSEIRYYAPLVNLLFEQLLAEIMTTIPSKDSKGIYLILDEASELKLSGTLETAYSNVRKFKAGILSAYQHEGQVKRNYGLHTAASLRANSYATVFFPNQPIESAREISSILGSFEFIDEDSNMKKTRELLTPDEVRNIPSDRAIVLCGRHRAIYAKMTPYFAQAKYKKYKNLPMPKFHKKLPYDEIPLIRLPKIPKHANKN